MKIKIEFEQKEKIEIASTLECPLTEDKKEGTKGKFGSFIYDPKGSIDIELKTEFILAYTSVIKSAVGLIKSFVATIEVLTKSWLEDIERINFEEEKETDTKSEEDLICPVERINKENSEDDEPLIKKSPITEETKKVFEDIMNNGEE